ncbi:hypothetical protein POSPLADRAFT_1063797 [Postia placenta MAD-698-R-SB12]|uniref:Uncharacterized protein n=1 Tax=Postia placenta MAD-698-R-SB12 TaxID=670580 RepID=A0A1X6NEL9_9APHY|nr:hypothetical protein POSPLADRAFT_1063797 [Postia placenta MAD-698-R-SB12]OSX66823.1 hypothetical protein POSPLADRAFT_1063797 [Postia placenta MAD-698-R-SB12]
MDERSMSSSDRQRDAENQKPRPHEPSESQNCRVPRVVCATEAERPLRACRFRRPDRRPARVRKEAHDERAAQSTEQRRDCENASLRVARGSAYT